MPYRRKPRRKYRPRRRRRMGRGRRYFGGRKQSVPRTSLLGNNKLVKLKYHAGLLLQSDIVGTPDSHLYSCNGMFDPDITGGGHQPRGFDQLMALYDHYVVLTSKCVATFMQTTGIPSQLDSLSQSVGIVLRDNASFLTNQNAILEDRNVSWRCLSAFTGGNPIRVVKSFSARKYLGRASPLSDHQLKGNSLTNPVEQAYFQVFVAPIGVNQNMGSVQVSVDLTFVAMLIEPKQPAES